MKRNAPYVVDMPDLRIGFALTAARRWVEERAMNRIIYKIVNGLRRANEWFQMAICLWFETINSDLERIKRGGREE